MNGFQIDATQIALDELRERADAAESRCTELETALAYYADPATYKSTPSGGWSPIASDKGRVARAAIKGTSHEC